MLPRSWYRFFLGCKNAFVTQNRGLKLSSIARIFYCKTRSFKLLVVKKRHIYQYQNQWQWGESGTYSLSYIRFFIVLGQLWTWLKRRYWLMCQGGSGGTVCLSEWQRQGNLSRSTVAVVFPAMVGMMMMMMMTEKTHYFLINICVVSGESKNEKSEKDYWENGESCARK